jgi:hypothetical protein
MFNFLIPSNKNLCRSHIFLTISLATPCARVIKSFKDEWSRIDIDYTMAIPR